MANRPDPIAHVGTLSQAFAERFAREWIAAWNSRDLERILSHYDDDFQMSSPRIPILTNEASGILRGKEAVRAYWRSALELSPHLYFALESVYLGADCVIIQYASPRGPASEVFFFGPDGRVVRAAASYVGTT
ncbi:MAG: nuclear transport factor 2 family protein [Myxococcota bacterium]